MAAKTNSGLVAVDWGSSSFRLSAIDGSGNLRQQRASARGVAQIPRARLLPFLRAEIASLPADMNRQPVVLCGMVGSSIGLQEVPYLPCPTDPTQLAASLIPLEVEDTGLDARIVPGLSARNAAGNLEVMRGEETQIVGWLAENPRRQVQSGWLCLPGTHAKWVKIENGQVQQFSTALTGELYALLGKHSVLVQGEQQFDQRAFDTGLAAGDEQNSLGFSLFSARTRVLDQKLLPRHSAAYLSGLLIGSEIHAQLDKLSGGSPVHLIGEGHITELYRNALARYDIQAHLYDGAELALRGLRELYLRSGNHD